jgi:hypothetical protein
MPFTKMPKKLKRKTPADGNENCAMKMHPFCTIAKILSRVPTRYCAASLPQVHLFQFTHASHHFTNATTHARHSGKGDEEPLGGNKLPPGQRTRI